MSVIVETFALTRLLLNDNFANKCAFLQEDGVLKLFESSVQCQSSKYLYLRLCHFICFYCQPKSSDS